MIHGFRHRDVGLNLLVALAISMVVNFSSLVLLLVDSNMEQVHPAKERILSREEVGSVHLSPNGHGYLVYENGDSCYISTNRAKRWGLHQGEQLKVDLLTLKRKGAYPQVIKIRERDGKEFDYEQLLNRPVAKKELCLQILSFFLLSFLLLLLLTKARQNYTTSHYIKACVICLGVTCLFYFLIPVANLHRGTLHLNFMNGRLVNYALLLKCSFTVVVTILYGWIFRLVSQRQAMEIENEKLTNENLSTRYNMLKGQINPHFFFNSLNSLAMLVREKEEEKALEYIDQLSFTFRYILQNGKSNLLTLEEELKFAEAYSYLFKIRYEDKIVFQQNIEPKFKGWILPSLSLQPLIENAVKHNSLTRQNPLHITISTQDNILVVRNEKHPKLTQEPSTGIGLENLTNRWQLITGKGIVVINGDDFFEVRLPLQPPLEK